MTVGGLGSNGASFDLLPTGWLDQDVGTFPSRAQLIPDIRSKGGGVEKHWRTADQFPILLPVPVQ